MDILIINGPNLNLLGNRETGIYGDLSFDDYMEEIVKAYPQHNLSSYQSNIEGEIINRLQDANLEVNAVVLNAGGYTHTSVAIADAIRSIDIPVVEVHISNLLSREEYRHKSLIGSACMGTIMGFGLESYRLAIEFFTKRIF
ncbi:MAG: type II 3-dehydroquinate dehydratase [Bacteroidetes bacterium]|nr:MAG: type II 3-dehydroquinate dehydratase [Bacteroidota bacterium]